MKKITSTLILQLNVHLANSIGFNGLFLGQNLKKAVQLHTLIALVTHKQLFLCWLLLSN